MPHCRDHVERAVARVGRARACRVDERAVEQQRGRLGAVVLLVRRASHKTERRARRLLPPEVHACRVVVVAAGGPARWQTTIRFGTLHYSNKSNHNYL